MLGRAVFLLGIWGAQLQGATADNIHQSPTKQAFWSRTCAGMLAAFFEAIPPMGHRRFTLDSVRESADRTLRHLQENHIQGGTAISVDASVFVDSQTLSSFNRANLSNRLTSLRDSLHRKDTLVAIFSGQDRIDGFVSRFEAKTDAFTKTCYKPEDFRQKALSGKLGLTLLLSAAAVAGGQILSDNHNFLAWTLAGLGALQGLCLPYDFPIRLKSQVDGPRGKLPALLAKSQSIIEGRTEAPEWLVLGTQFQFSYSTLEELWQQGLGDYVNSSLAKSIELDDWIAMMPFWEKVRAHRELRRLQREKLETYEAERMIAGKTPVFLDYILIKAGTMGFFHPRLIVALRLPEGFQEDSDGGGSGYFDPEPTPARPKNKPVPVH